MGDDIAANCTADIFERRDEQRHVVIRKAQRTGRRAQRAVPGGLAALDEETIAAIGFGKRGFAGGAFDHDDAVRTEISRVACLCDLADAIAALWRVAVAQQRIAFWIAVRLGAGVAGASRDRKRTGDTLARVAEHIQCAAERTVERKLDDNP